MITVEVVALLQRAEQELGKQLSADADALDKGVEGDQEQIK